MKPTLLLSRMIMEWRNGRRRWMNAIQIIVGRPIRPLSQPMWGALAAIRDQIECFVDGFLFFTSPRSKLLPKSFCHKLIARIVLEMSELFEKKMGRTCPIKSEKAAKFPHHQMMIVKICLTLAIITENHRRSNSCPSDQITPIALWLCEALCSFDWASEQSFCVEIFDGLLFPETLLPLGNCGYGVYIETSGAQTTSFKTHSRWDQKYEILYPLLSTSLEI